jgi:hypothetical protein
LLLQLLVHHLERVIGDAQRGEHLLLRLFSLAALNGVMPLIAAPCHAGRTSEAAMRSSQIMRVRWRAACELELACARSAATLHHLALQAGRRWLALQALCSSRSKSSMSNGSSNGTDVLLQLAFGLGPQQLQSALQLALHRGQRRASVAAISSGVRSS